MDSELEQIVQQAFDAYPDDYAAVLRCLVSSFTADGVDERDRLTLLQLRELVVEEAERRGIRAARRLALEAFREGFRRLSPPKNGHTPHTVFVPDRPDPWPEPVDGHALVARLIELCTTFVSLDPGYAEVVAFWTLATYGVDETISGGPWVTFTPYLTLISPARQSGKTTLMGLISELVSRPLQAANVTSAAIFRALSTTPPITLLVDEYDHAIRSQRDLVDVLNPGHRRDMAYVLRVEREPSGAFVLARYTTFGFKALASIGRIPDTVKDRSIVIRMQRRPPEVHTRRMTLDDRATFLDLRRQCVRWVMDHHEALGQWHRWSELPRGLSHRAVDNWGELVRYADVIGGEWPERLREIAARIERREAQMQDDETPELRLLADIRFLLKSHQISECEVGWLREQLLTLDWAPWETFSGGRPVTKSWIGRVLGSFGVRSSVVRRGVTTVRVYRVEDFSDPFRRYLPSDDSTDVDQLGDIEPSREPDWVTDQSL